MISLNIRIRNYSSCFDDVLMVCAGCRESFVTCYSLFCFVAGLRAMSAEDDWQKRQVVSGT